MSFIGTQLKCKACEKRFILLINFRLMVLLTIKLASDALTAKEL